MVEKIITVDTYSKSKLYIDHFLNKKMFFCYKHIPEIHSCARYNHNIPGIFSSIIIPVMCESKFSKSVLMEATNKNRTLKSNTITSTCARCCQFLGVTFGEVCLIGDFGI